MSPTFLDSCLFSHQLIICWFIWQLKKFEKEEKGDTASVDSDSSNSEVLDDKVSSAVQSPSSKYQVVNAAIVICKSVKVDLAGEGTERQSGDGEGVAHRPGDVRRCAQHAEKRSDGRRRQAASPAAGRYRLSVLLLLVTGELLSYVRIDLIGASKQQ